MAQINVPKVNAYAHSGSSASANVSKINMYARLVPGTGSFAPEWDSFAYAQKVRRS